MAEQLRVGLHREWTHPEFAAIARALQETAGLVFPPNRRESAEAGMRRAMAATCISDPRDLRLAMAGAGETRDVLITELTVGETFFLREHGQFEFLRASVLPELRSSIGERRLRVWSAGCATGEEPYSLAIVLREAAWTAPPSILGTDLASVRLASARRARYTAWSMRGVDDAIIARYFERRGKQFILTPAIRQSVEFRVLNLASTEYPSAASGVEQMDVVFCRNVLIYFDLATIAAIAQRLLATLAPGGWLFLGASDPSIAELVPCEVVLTGAGLAYRPPGTTSPARPRLAPLDALPAEPETLSWATERVDADFTMDRPSAGGWTAFEQPGAPDRESPGVDNDSSIRGAWRATDDSFESAYDQGDYESATRLARTAIARDEADEAAWVVLVRSLANRGELDAAGEACAAALDLHRLSAELTHLHGILLAEAGRHVEAAAAARRALYLDSGYVVAHLALGDALSRVGDVAGARRAFVNAQSLLDSLSPEAPVPGADTANASQLSSIARFRLQKLGEQPASRSR